MPPKEIVRAHRKAVEGDLVFLHAAIAQDLDLGAGHAGGGNGFSSLPRGFSASSMETRDSRSPPDN